MHKVWEGRSGKQRGTLAHVDGKSLEDNRKHCARGSHVLLPAARFLAFVLRTWRLRVVASAAAAAGLRLLHLLHWRPGWLHSSAGSAALGPQLPPSEGRSLLPALSRAAPSSRSFAAEY